jgi:hypothetical protein
MKNNITYKNQVGQTGIQVENLNSNTQIELD